MSRIRCASPFPLTLAALVALACLVAPSAALAQGLSDPTRTSTGHVDLLSLGTGQLGGVPGGLYLDGSNQMPEEHRQAGLDAAGRIVPRDGLGNPSAAGEVVVSSLSMSNGAQEWGNETGSWKAAARLFADPRRAAHVRFVNGAVSSTCVQGWSRATGSSLSCADINGNLGPSPCTSSDGNCYTRLQETVLAPEGLTMQQIQAAWFKPAKTSPQRDFSEFPDAGSEPYWMARRMGEALRAMKTRMPNLQQAFTTSRIYSYEDYPNCGGGGERECQSAEPWVYYAGFGVRFAIEAQIRQCSLDGVPNACLGPIDPVVGDVSYVGTACNGGPCAPFLWWNENTYMWRDGVHGAGSDSPNGYCEVTADANASHVPARSQAECTQRAPGTTYRPLAWRAVDFEADGLHPSSGAGFGEWKVATLLYGHVVYSALTQPWYCGANCPAPVLDTTGSSGGGGGGDGDGPVIRASSDKTSGATPLPVYFDASATTSTCSEVRDPFHDLRFEWEFGDAGAGQWTPSGNLRNRAIGALASHWFEQPGTYRVRVTVTDPCGGRATHTLPDVVVADARLRAEWSGGAYCYSANATVAAGCPTGFTQVTNAASLDASLGGRIANDSIHLFERGESFTLASGVRLHGTTGGRIGSFGAGVCTPADRTACPRLGPGTVTASSEWVVHDVALDGSLGSGASPQTTPVDLPSTSPKDDFGLWNVDVRQHHNCYDGFLTAAQTRFSDRVFLGELKCRVRPGANGTWSLFLEGSRHALQGLDVDNCSGGGAQNVEGDIRFVYWNKILIQDSLLTRTCSDPGAKNLISLRACGTDSQQSARCSASTDSREAIIADNQLLHWVGTSFVVTCTDNECDATGTNGTYGYDVIAERNFARCVPGGTCDAFRFFNSQAEDVSVRENVIDLTGLTPDRFDLFFQGGGGATKSGAVARDEFRAHSNTVVCNDCAGKSINVCQSTTGSGHECRNNLVWAPGATVAQSSGFDVSDPFRSASSYPFAGGSYAGFPSERSDFRLASPLAGAVPLPIGVDAAGLCRDAAPDFGAIEFGGASCTQGSVDPVCGNARLEAGEACDDGNRTSGDGCSASCQIEAPVCGNARLEAGEACDDGNRTNGDGCSASCQIEAPVCGNARLEAGEACDDGNRTNGDGCSASCQIEAPVCGNARLEAGEACDDGNRTNGDGCSASCQIEAPVCGNARLEAGEACDDGNRTNGDGCSASCQIEAPVCGNARLEAGEACDDGNRTSGDGCSASCQIEAPVCGNARLEAGEACDDGNRTNGDGCSASCQIEAPVCGNARLEAGEACDDGNLAPGDGCNASCQIESGDASLPIFLNAGPRLVDGGGNVWEPDAAFASDGTLLRRVEPISRTTRDELYYDVRVGSLAPERLRYEIPVSGIGPYAVRLHFAEIGGGVTRRGQRVFDLDVEGAFTIEDLDVFAEVGRSAAYVRRFQVLVDDGSLTIEMVPSVGRPMISAIEIFEPTSAPTNPPPKQPGLRPRHGE